MEGADLVSRVALVAGAAQGALEPWEIELVTLDLIEAWFEANLPRPQGGRTLVGFTVRLRAGGRVCYLQGVFDQQMDAMEAGRLIVAQGEEPALAQLHAGRSVAIYD